MEKKHEADREEGIQAIIFLQGLSGINEPREKAEKGWDEFSEKQKQDTIFLYRQMNNPEIQEKNVDIICSECSTKIFPNQGKFTEKDMRFTRAVKVKFQSSIGSEVMWVRISSHNETEVTGTVTNHPVLPSSPKFGAEITAPYSDIIEVE